jgi:hypothetical protein
MRRILAVVVLALAPAVGLPAAANAGGPTSVLVTQPGQSAGALYYDDAAYDALLELLPVGETRGKPLPPGRNGTDYTLTWLIHDVEPWRWDRVRIDGDGNAWVATAMTAGATPGWEPLGSPQDEALAQLLAGVLGDSATPTVVSVPTDVSPAPATSEVAPPAPPAPSTAWFPLTGWRWALPGALLGLAVGAVAARRSREAEPRQVLVGSGA